MLKDNRARVKVVDGQDDFAATVQSLRDRHRRGEIGCAAFRIYGLDGSWEDVVVGASSDAEREQALADLHAGLQL